MSLFDTDLASLQTLANDGLTLPTMNGDASVAPSAAPVSNSSTSSTPNSGGILGAVMNPVQTVQNAVSNSVSSWLFSSRFAAVMLGLICIAGAIFLFKGPSIIQTTTRAAVAG